MAPHFRVLTVEDCPHTEATLALVHDVAASLHLEPGVEHTLVKTCEEAEEIQFQGSPSVQVDGRDIGLELESEPVMCCRLYAEAGGVPPRWLVESAALRALRPAHVLFLCVANSARSQMAEGIARSLAPAHVTIASAGSVPTSVREEAITVLQEIGIDITQHTSKPVEAIDANQVQAVITLCADEVCPPTHAGRWRIHWGLEDPAGAEAEVRMDSFRKTRDELAKRLKHLFDGWTS